MRPGLAAALEELELTEKAEAPEEGNDVTDILEGEEWEAVVRHRKREQRLRAARENGACDLCAHLKAF